ncbi:MAG: alpha-1,2-fucosyltransferase [Planctomycetota bacterium]
MIVVNVFGGLGNQMFQYAAGRRLAHVRGTELRYDASALAGTTRQLQLDAMRIAAGPATPEQLATVRGRARRRWRRLLERARTRPGDLRYVREHGFRFDPSVLDLPDDVYLDGYWQCERYFDDVADLIRAELELREPPDEADRRVLELVESVCSVSVHVRRGDFVSDPRASRYHGVCDADYYLRATALVAGLVDRPHFVVFSDEPDWARANLDLGHPTTIVDHNGPDRGPHDLRLMSRCRHHVIANSSFSWWAAWLDPRPDAIVCAPKRWFADPRPDTSTIVPERWHRL